MECNTTFALNAAINFHYKEILFEMGKQILLVKFLALHISMVMLIL